MKRTLHHPAPLTWPASHDAALVLRNAIALVEATALDAPAVLLLYRAKVVEHRLRTGRWPMLEGWAYDI